LIAVRCPAPAAEGEVFRRPPVPPRLFVVTSTPAANSGVAVFLLFTPPSRRYLEQALARRERARKRYMRGEQVNPQEFQVGSVMAGRWQVLRERGREKGTRQAGVENARRAFAV